jgi:hypothetical protein
MSTTTETSFEFYIDHLECFRAGELAYLQEEVQLESLVHDARVHGTLDDQRELRYRLHELRIAREAHVRYHAEKLRNSLDL